MMFATSVPNRSGAMGCIALASHARKRVRASFEPSSVSSHFAAMLASTTTYGGVLLTTIVVYAEIGAVPFLARGTQDVG